MARIVPERSIAVYERLGGAEARQVAERYYDVMDEQAFADFVRVCLPLLSTYELTSEVVARTDWNPEVVKRWMAGEAKQVDVRGDIATVETPALVLAGEDDAWAPLESAREVAELLGGPTRFRSFARARHSVFRDAPGAFDELRPFLDHLGPPEPA